MKRIRCAVALIACCVLSPPELPARPVVVDTAVTDVTPTAFSVTWVAGEPSVGRIEVFSDREGLHPVAPAVSNESARHPPAEDLGVHKIQVAGLSAATIYFYRTITTSKGTGESTVFPEDAPLASVVTERVVSRVAPEGDQQVPFANSQLAFEVFRADGKTPAIGTLLVVKVQEAHYPLTAFVGEGSAPPLTIVDLNNLFGGAEGSNLDLRGGESVTLTLVAGAHGKVSYFMTVAADSGECRFVRTEPQAGTVGGRHGSIRLVSTARFDGYVLEASERSGRGGFLNSRSAGIRLGDDRADRQFRGILSFDTSTLPDNAVISSARLSLKRQGVTGSDPFGTHGSLLGDIVRGTFSGSAELQLHDFEASGGLRAGIDSFTAGAEEWHIANLSQRARSIINTRGHTQFRLRFARDDNDDRDADIVLIHSGEASLGFRPMLEIGYEIP